MDNDLIKAINSDFHRRIKAEQNKAIREFAERLKKNAQKFTEYDEGGWGCTVYAVKVEDIEKTVKEMREEADEPHN